MRDLRNLVVLYEDNHLLAVMKPGGWLVQGDATGDLPLVEYAKQYIKVRYKKEGNVFLGVCHRLDRPVSGVVVFAKTSKALTRMNRLFQEQKVEKTYLAVANNAPNPLEGKLEHLLVKDTGKNKARIVTSKRKHPKAKKSILTYKLKSRIAGHALIEIRPKTGRPHQIRVQMASIDCAIRGDVKYGYGRWNKDSTIHLHCLSMAFVHPVKNTPIFIQGFPPIDGIWNIFRSYFN